MPRLRSIKPEFWSSEQIMELSLLARLAFIGLWNFCDDQGVHPASPKTLKAEVFPSDEIRIDEVAALIGEMVAQKLVVEYSADGKNYWAVTGWKHQYIKHPAIKYPPPPGSVPGAPPPAAGNIPPGRGELSGNVPPGRPPEKEKEKEKDKDGKPLPASGKPMRGASAIEAGPDFSRFWLAWPKKVGKKASAQAWQRLRPDGPMLAAILAAVERIAADPQQQADAWQFLPDPERWLKGRRWEDQPPHAVAGYAPAEIAVITAYNAGLGEQGWPSAATAPYSATRAAAIRDFLGYGIKPDWVATYFGYLGQTLKPMEGLGFDWAIQRETFLRAREGNFKALREVTA